MLDVIQLLRELEEQIGIKALINNALNDEVDFASAISEFPAKLYVDNIKIKRKDSYLVRKKAMDDKGKEFFVDYITYNHGAPFNEDVKLIKVHAFEPPKEISYITSITKTPSALIEINNGDNKSKIAMGYGQGTTEYDETKKETDLKNLEHLIKKDIKTKYIFHNNYQNYPDFPNIPTTMDTLDQDISLTVNNNLGEVFYGVTINIKNRVFRNIERLNPENEIQKIEHMERIVKITKISYPNRERISESITYKLERLIPGIRENVTLSETAYEASVEGNTNDQSGKKRIPAKLPFSEIVDEGKIENEYRIGEQKDSEATNRGNELFQILTEFNLMREYEQKDFEKWKSKQEKVQEQLYTNKLVAIIVDRPQSTTLIDEVTR